MIDKQRYKSYQSVNLNFI